MDGSFWVLIIVLVVVSIAVGIIRWVMLGYAVYKLIRDWESNLAKTEASLRALSAQPGPGRQALAADAMARIAALQRQYRDLDALQRQKYELRVGELHGMAAQAGLDWTPPNY